MDSTEYSTSELRLIKILERNGGSPMSSKNIAKIHYSPGKSPTNAVRSVVTTLNKVMKKTRRRRECFVIKKTGRRGPHPVKFWMEMRKSTSLRESLGSSRGKPSP